MHGNGYGSRIDITLGQKAGCAWLIAHGIDPNTVPVDGRVRRVGLHAEVDVFLTDADGHLVVAGNEVVTTTERVRLTSHDRLVFPRGPGRHRRPRRENIAAGIHAVRVS